MKKFLALFFCIMFIFSLCGCGAGNYHVATEGELNVSLPEKTVEDSEISEYVKAISGKWKLVSIINDGKTETFENSYYEFRESGRIKIKLRQSTDMGTYTIDETTITIKNGNNELIIKYVIDGDKLTITDQSNDVHNLVKEEGNS
ncbi:MAG: lipocalin family protein [Acutalibacteraceae bacterium]|nr:lipocalin family protein [Acutalibacteraceae bacterium]